MGKHKESPLENRDLPEIVMDKLKGKVLKKTIYMEPVGKGRPRVVRKGKKITTYTPSKTIKAEDMIRNSLMREEIFFERGTALHLSAVFYRTRPKSSKKSVIFPVTKPDWDNYGKLLADALESFVYDNDSQITTAVIKKRFGSPPRIELELKEDEQYD